MTKKRFEYIRTKYRMYIQDIEKDGEYRKGYLGSYGELDLGKITDLLNSLNDENEQLKSEKVELLEENITYKNAYLAMKDYEKENEQLKEHQRTLEAKIVRLKDRVKTFEKHYSLKDIERYKKMENCNCITAKRLEE